MVDDLHPRVHVLESGHVWDKKKSQPRNTWFFYRRNSPLQEPSAYALLEFGVSSLAGNLGIATFSTMEVGPDLISGGCPFFPNLKVVLALNSRAENFAELSEAAGAYRRELAALPKDELEGLVSAQLDAVLRIARDKAEKEEQQRSFNQPWAKADFDHWAKMSYWTIDEAVALSLGKNPKSADWKYIQPIIGISPFAAEFAAKRELLLRAKKMGQLWESTIPSVFLAWAERMRFSVPAEMVSALKALGIQIADWKSLFDQRKGTIDQLQQKVVEKKADRLAAIKDHSATITKMGNQRSELAAGYSSLIDQKDNFIALKDERIASLEARLNDLETAPLAKPEKPLGAKERDSLLKLVIGMAVKGYGYNPRAAKNAATKEIADDLRLLGLSLDEDTIRKYLVEARELMAAGETEQNY